MKVRSAVSLVVMCGVNLLAAANAAAPTPQALRVTIIEPEVQGRRVIDLFRGARVPHPAAALAAWKHATKGKGSLGKPLEAAISVMNPGMVRELRGLDATRILFGYDPATGRPHWGATVPHDDGSIAAMASAVALTDGACLEPIGACQVLRLGPDGAPLEAEVEGKLALGSSRDDLQSALERLSHPEPELKGPSGLVATLDPAGLRAAQALNIRRLSAFLDAIGSDQATARVGLGDDFLLLESRARLSQPLLASKSALRIEPSWPDNVPRAGVLGAVSLALDNSPEGLNAAFTALDRVDRAAPERANLAPLRTRINLVAIAARVRLEADLWPSLRGVTATLFQEPDGRQRGAVAVLHTVDDAAAARVARDVVPRLAKAFLRAGETKTGPVGGPAFLGAIDGKPLVVQAISRDVVIGWGDHVLEEALAARQAPEKSAGAQMRNGWGPVAPARAGAVWVGRVPGAAPAGSPLARALADAPPAVWSGSNGPDEAIDIARWPGLRATIARWLDALPLDPPPAG